MKRNKPAVSFTTVKKIVVSMVFALNHGVALAEDAKKDAGSESLSAKDQLLIKTLTNQSQERTKVGQCQIQADKLQDLQTQATNDCNAATYRDDTGKKSKKSSKKDESGEAIACAQRIVNCMGNEESYVEPEKPESNPLLTSLVGSNPQLAGMSQFLTNDPGINASDDKRCPVMTYEKYVADQKRIKDEIADLDKKIKDTQKELDEAKKDNLDKQKDSSKAVKEAQKAASDKKAEISKDRAEATKNSQQAQKDAAAQIYETKDKIQKAQSDLLQRQQQCSKAMASYDDSLLKTKCYAEMVKSKKLLEDSGTYSANSFSASLTNTLRAAYKQCRQDGRRDFLDKEANCKSEMSDGARSINSLNEQIASLQQSIETETLTLQARMKELDASGTEADTVAKNELQEQIGLLQQAQTELTNKTQQVQKDIADIESKKADLKLELQKLGQAPASNATKSWKDAKASLENYASTGQKFARSCCQTAETMAASGGFCDEAKSFGSTMEKLGHGKADTPAMYRETPATASTSTTTTPAAATTTSAPAANKASTNGDGTK